MSGPCKIAISDPLPDRVPREKLALMWMRAMMPIALPNTASLTQLDVVPLASFLWKLWIYTNFDCKVHAVWQIRTGICPALWA
jgi:hypothetical protein